METSYLLPYLFSAADCGGDEGSARKRRKRIGSRTGWQARVAPCSLGDIIREIGFGIFQILPRKHSYECSTGRAENRIFIPKRLVFDNQITSVLCRLRQKRKKYTTYGIEL